jgi:phosphoglucomutase
VKIVYTPLHGTGARHVEGVLGSLGLKGHHRSGTARARRQFPDRLFPNPEEAAALKMALELGAEVGADVVMATDRIPTV